MARRHLSVNWSQIGVVVAFMCVLALTAPAELAPACSEIEHWLEIAPPGASAVRLDLKDALRALKSPSVSVALMDADKVSCAHAWGNASVHTLYQAASLSKLDQPAFNQFRLKAG
jgi:CubicO group peptidase (beta-lactamase class C family)